MTLASTSTQSIEELFHCLADRWQEETMFLSSTSAMAMHPAYQRIIGLGPVAIPLILQELSERPNHWFWALVAITGENPVPETDQGKLSAMTESWLRWGRNNGYLP